MTTTLRFLDEWTPCRRCGLPAITKKLAGRIPMHPACDPTFWAAVADAEQTVAALGMFADALGPLTVAGEQPVQPHEVGACQRCGRPMRRYGGAASGNRCRQCRAAA